MKLKYKGRDIKIIPLIYAGIENITDYLDDFEQKRLTNNERVYLDNALFESNFNQLIASLEHKDAVLYEKARNSKPLYAVKIKIHGSGTSYAIRTDNQISLKCSKQLYVQCADKRKNATQLSLF